MQLLLTFAAVVGGSFGVAAWWVSVEVDGGPVVSFDPVSPTYLDIVWMNEDAQTEAEYVNGVPRERSSLHAGGYSTARVVKGMARPWAFDEDGDAVPRLVAPWRDALAPDEVEATERKVERQNREWLPLVAAYPIAKRGAEQFWREGRREGERLASRDIDNVLGEANEARQKVERRADEFRDKLEKVERQAREAYDEDDVEVEDDEDVDEVEDEVEDHRLPPSVDVDADEVEAFGRETAADGGET
jgi:hypothetical protein